MTKARTILLCPRPRLLGAALILLACINCGKGLNPRVQDWGLPFWVVTYEHGFVRRGLLGTLFQACAVGIGPDLQKPFIVMLHMVACVAFCAMLLIPLLRDIVRYATDPFANRLLVAAAVVLACGPCFTSFVSLTGYVDPLLFLLAFASYALARRGFALGAAALCAIGPFVHEAFVFVWIAPAVLLLIQGRREARLRPSLVIALVPVVATLVVFALHSPAAASAMVDSAALNDVTKDGLRRYQYGLHAPEALAIMVAQFRAWPSHVALACGAFLLPSALVTIAALLLARRGRRFSWWEQVGLVCCALAPAAVLMVAWDLSRLLLWTMPTSVLVLRFVAEGSVVEAPERGGRFLGYAAAGTIVLCTLCAAIGFTSPSVFAYFDYCTADTPSCRLGIDRWPPAHVAYRFINVYNRHRMLDLAVPKDLADKLTLAGSGPPAEDSRRTGALKVAAGTVALGINSSLATGDYDVAFHLEVAPDCSGGDVTVAVISLSRWARTLASERVSVEEGRVVTVRVRVDDHDSALGPVDFRVQGLGGCVGVSGVVLSLVPPVGG